MTVSRATRLVRLLLPLALAPLAPAATLEAQVAGPASSPRADVARAQGERKRAKSGYFPQLNGLASYQRTLQSQFSALEGDDGQPGGPPPPECAAFVPQPGLSVEQRLDSLEAAVECASNADPFAHFRQAGLGRTDGGALLFGRLANAFRDFRGI